MQQYLIPLGGILTGSGLVSMLFGWEIGGAPGMDMAQAPDVVGFSGVSDLALNGTGMLAFILIFAGVALMVWGNSSIWKETGGY